jgi:glycosyltransferase involved in cell wall biosynthesis
MKFITYSEATHSTTADTAGVDEYGPFYTPEHFAPLLGRFGEVIAVERLEDVDAIYRDLKSKGETSVLLSFTTPDKTPTNLECPAIPVFPLEYSSLPNPAPGSDNWANVLDSLGRAITHSSYALNTLKEAAASTFSAESIPAPVWDEFEHLRTSTPKALQKKHSIELGATVVDSDHFDISIDGANPKIRSSIFDAKMFGAKKIAWDGSPIGHDLHAGGSQLFMPGFYPAESWGTWSQTEDPWIMLPVTITGEVELVLQARTFGGNKNREVTFSLGDTAVNATLPPGADSIVLKFKLKSPANHLRIAGLDTTPPPDSEEQRTLGIGISSLLIRRVGTNKPQVEQDTGNGTATKARNTLTLQGVVYTAFFNPTDEREDWKNIVTAFCRALGARADATLVLKVHCDYFPGYLEDIFHMFTQLPAFKCRIVVVHGSLDKKDFEQLVSATSYIVNSAKCAGQCLPQTAFMAAGTPSISTANTAMADYINESNAFVVDSFAEPTYWPEDPQQALQTLWYRVSWESLVTAYTESYEVATQYPKKYQAMGRKAIESLEGFCSVETLAPRFERIISSLER